MSVVVVPGPGQPGGPEWIDAAAIAVPADVRERLEGVEAVNATQDERLAALETGTPSGGTGDGGASSGEVAALSERVNAVEAVNTAQNERITLIEVDTAGGVGDVSTIVDAEITKHNQAGDAHQTLTTQIEQGITAVESELTGQLAAAQARVAALESMLGLIPGGVAPIVVPPVLDPFVAKVAAARAGTGTVTVAAVGSSTMEGHGAGEWRFSAVEHLGRALRAGSPGMSSVQPGMVNVYADYPCSFVGAASMAAGSESTGLGRSAALRAAGDGIAYTWIGSSVRVGYGQYSGGPIMQVLIDGTEVATINSNGATDRYIEWTSPQLTRGEHTLTITHTGNTGNFGYIRLLRGFDRDEDAGVRLISAGRAGWSAADLAAGVAQWGPAWDDLQPDLVLIAIGVNDYRLAAPRTAGQVRADLQTTIDRIRQGTPNAIMVITIPPEPGGRTSPDPWPTWVNMFTTTATVNGGVVVDEAPYIRTAADGGPYVSDRLHFDPAAQAFRGGVVWPRLLGL